MEREVREFLTNNAAFEGMQVDLETLPSGRVSGQVVWEGFAGRDHVERQQTLRAALREHFGPEVQYIGVLLTYTPAEMEEMVAA